MTDVVASALAAHSEERTTRLRGRSVLFGVAGLGALAIATIIATWIVLGQTISASGVEETVVTQALCLLSIALAFVIAVRRPDNVVAVLVALFGAMPCLLNFGDIYDLADQRLPQRFPISPYLIAFGEGLWMLWYIPAALLMLYFPTGRLSRRWRFVAVGLIANVAVFCVTAAFTPTAFDPPYQNVPNPLPMPHGLWLVLVIAGNVVCLLGLMGMLIASLCAVVRRYRRAVGVERAQLSWFLLGAGVLPATLLLCWLSYLLIGTADLVSFGLVTLLVSIPAATLIALVRHDLYDVDRALSATINYALVTVALLSLFTLASAFGGLALGHRSPAVAAVATAVCAAALAPLRNRLRAGVDRRIYPQRRRAIEAIDALRTQIHEGAARPEQLESVLRVALGDAALRVGYRVPGSATDIDSDGSEVGDGMPVLLAGEQVGVLRGGTTARALLREVADAAGLMFEVVRLRAGLGDALRDVESSRTRLLQAGYDERRRLERDLHDGAQQRLVSLGMSLRIAQRHLADGTVDLDGLLDDSVAELGSAVAELRQIAHGLRPSSLDDGLGPALTTLLGRLPVAVQLDIDHGDVPDEIATTAFFVASEAVTNAIKHAQADRIALAVRQADHALRVRITDNGSGGAVLRAGAGLAGLTDRVAAAGGALRVESTPGTGTVVEAVLPCAS